MFINPCAHRSHISLILCNPHLKWILWRKIAGKIAELFCRNEKTGTEHMLLIAHGWEALKLQIKMWQRLNNCKTRVMSIKKILFHNLVSRKYKDGVRNS